MTKYFLSLIMVAVLQSCGGNDTAPVPRRTAYQRIYEYKPEYKPVEAAPLRIEANSSADVKVKPTAGGGIGMTVRYPRYNASVYYTFSPVTDGNIDEVIDNRTRRMHLNIGAVPGTVSENTNAAGYYSNIVEARAAFTTPVQFISLKKEHPRWVVSGAVFFDNADSITSVDSIAPMVDVISRDIRHALVTLADK